MLLGHARGKVGSLVFSRSNGQQITRARAEVIKNPRTRAQLLQRIIMNTGAQAYSLMKPIVDHSFEGIAPGQKSMSFFMSETAKMLQRKLAGRTDLYNVQAFTPLGFNNFALNGYVIAKGSLPKIVPTYVLDDATSEAYGTISLAANTYEAIINQYGLQRGDQITFVFVHQNGEDVSLFKFCRVILDPRNADGSEAALSTALVTDGAITLPSPKNEGAFTKLSFADSKLSFVAGDESTCVAVGVIVSRKSAEGVWSRSNAELITATIDQVEINYSMGIALDMSMNATADLENPRYLNNAGASNAVIEQTFYNITLSTTGTGSSGAQISGGGRIVAGQAVTLTTSNGMPQVRFDGWRIVGQTQYLSTQQEYTFTPEGNMSIEAVWTYTGGE